VRPRLCRFCGYLDHGWIEHKPYAKPPKFLVLFYCPACLAPLGHATRPEDLVQPTPEEVAAMKIRRKLYRWRHRRRRNRLGLTPTGL